MLGAGLNVIDFLYGLVRRCGKSVEHIIVYKKLSFLF
jgi:hypothetical protein